MRALQDHADRRHIPATATETRHVGFYRLKYKEVWEARSDVAAVGGRVLSGKKHGKIIGGRMTADGTVFYEGLPKGFGGYLHRAELSQDAEALDLRCIRIRPECREVFEKSWEFRIPRSGDYRKSSRYLISLRCRRVRISEP